MKKGPRLQIVFVQELSNRTVQGSFQRLLYCPLLLQRSESVVGLTWLLSGSLLILEEGWSLIRKEQAFTGKTKNTVHISYEAVRRAIFLADLNRSHKEWESV